MFKTTIRSLRRNKVFSAINIVGLAIGTAVFLLITEFVFWEWSANRSLPNFKQLYRVAVVEKGKSNYYLPPGYAAIIQQKFPEVQNAVLSADGLANGIVSVEKNGVVETFREDDIKYVESNFVKVMGFPVEKGTALLNQPQTLVMTASRAKKYFGSTDVIGKTLKLSNQFGTTTYQVSGVLADNRENIDIKSEVYLAIQTLASAANRSDNDWADPSTLDNGYSNLYLLLKPGADPEKLMVALDQFLHEANPNSKGSNVYLQPFRHMHLGPSINYPFETFGSLKLVYMLSLIALLILVIAWVNYINLSTVQAMRRAKETGVRKVLGATRGHLAWKFMSETLILALFALVVALGLVQLVQPLFNRVLREDLSLANLLDPIVVAVVIGVVLLGSLIAGTYVGLVLSSFKPIKVLKGKLQHSVQGVWMRKGLVVFQFSVSIIFIIATIVLYKQLNFMQTESLGMNLQQLLVVQGPTLATENQAERNATFKNRLASFPFIQKVCGSNNVPGQGYNFSTEGITRQLASPGDDKKGYNMLIVDQNFFDTYGITFKQGAVFSENTANRSWNNVRQVVINEKAAAQLGFDPGEQVVGKMIKWGEEFEVMGVVKDYHHLSLRRGIEPVIYLPSVSYGFFTVRIDVSNLQGKLGQIEKLYKELFPGNPFEYFFSDERFDQQYEQEKALGNVFITASLIAVFIACLGLFGLAAYAAQQRFKEIGVRKVLGASVSDITGLLSRDFIILVIVAIAIASPIGWWLMRSWLEEFPYRTGINWWVFAVAGFSAIAIALGTVGFQAVRAAKSNPVDALRSE
jgi:putative ABC transport system permease protein